MRPRIAIHKFSSCDGCQLALLNAGESLLTLAEQVVFVHFAEAGYLDEEAEVDIALVEGSLSTAQELRRIAAIRQRSRYLIAMGACATSGGIQALRNHADADHWLGAIYQQPAAIDLRPTATPLADHVRIDLAIPGCPVSGAQLLPILRDLIAGVRPQLSHERVCSECKRNHFPCVMVTANRPCLGAITAAGCGALCPSLGRDCYGCYGLAEQANVAALSAQFQQQGLSARAVAQRLQLIHSQAPALHDEAARWLAATQESEVDADSRGEKR